MVAILLSAVNGWNGRKGGGVKGGLLPEENAKFATKTGYFGYVSRADILLFVCYIDVHKD